MNALTVAQPSQGTAVVHKLQELEIMAEWFVKSGMYYKVTKEQFMVLFLHCQAHGIHPAVAMERYHPPIRGQVCIRATSRQQDLLKAGGAVFWHELTDTVADATFSPSQDQNDPRAIRVKRTIEDARKVMVEQWSGEGDGRRKSERPLTEGSQWKNHPMDMLRSWVVRLGTKAIGVFEAIPDEDEMEMMPQEDHSQEEISRRNGKKKELMAKFSERFPKAQPDDAVVVEPETNEGWTKALCAELEKEAGLAKSPERAKLIGEALAKVLGPDIKWTQEFIASPAIPQEQREAVRAFIMDRLTGGETNETAS